MSSPRRYNYEVDDDDIGCCGVFNPPRLVKKPRRRQKKIPYCCCGKKRTYKIFIQGELVADLNDSNQPGIPQVDYDETRSPPELYWTVPERHIYVYGDGNEDIKHTFKTLAVRARGGAQAEFPLRFRVVICPVSSTGCKSRNISEEAQESSELVYDSDLTYTEEMYFDLHQEMYGKPIAESSRHDITFSNDSAQTDLPYEDE